MGFFMPMAGILRSFREFLFSNCSAHPLSLKKKKNKLPSSLFSPHPPLVSSPLPIPLLFPPHFPAPISSPLRTHPLLLSFPTMPLGPCLLPISFPTPPSSPVPFLHSRHVLFRRPPLPNTSSLPRPSGSSASILFGSSSLSFRSNRIRSCLTEQKAFAWSCLTEWRAMAEQRPFVRPYLAEQGPPFDQTFRSVMFGRTVPKERGALGAGAGKPRRSAGREHMPKSRGRVLKKREETKGRGMLPGREKRMV